MLNQRSSLVSDLKLFTKGDGLKFSDGSSKLLSGHKFQDKYVVLCGEKLQVYRDIKVRPLPARRAPRRRLIRGLNDAWRLF